MCNFEFLIVYIFIFKNGRIMTRLFLKFFVRFFSIPNKQAAKLANDTRSITIVFNSGLLNFNCTSTGVNASDLKN